ncbi:MAG: hypothetical protein ACOCYP_02705 [Planctomycetota bacterium]
MRDDVLIEAYLADALAPAERRCFLERVAAEPALAVQLIAGAEMEALLHDTHRPPARQRSRARTARRVIAITLAAAAVLLAAALLMDHRPGPAPWRIVALSGTVLHHDQSSGAPRPFGDGGQLAAGDCLHLGHGARLHVRDARGTSWRLSGPARLALGAEPGALQLQRGTLTARIERPRPDAPFTVNSPHGRVSAVGTRFRFRVAALQSQLYVDQGTVATRCAGITATVDAGEHLVLDGRSGDEPRPTAPPRNMPLVHYGFADYADGRVIGDGAVPPLRADDPDAVRAYPGAIALAGGGKLHSEAPLPQLGPLLITPGRWSVVLWLKVPQASDRIDRLTLFALSQPDAHGTLLHRRVFTADAEIFTTARDDGLVHLVLIQDGSDMRVHVDGEAGLVNTAGPSHAQGVPVHLTLAGIAYAGDTALPWPIVYHDLAIYPRVLDSASIRTLYRAGPAGIPPTP